MHARPMQAEELTLDEARAIVALARAGAGTKHVTEPTLGPSHLRRLRVAGYVDLLDLGGKTGAMFTTAGADAVSPALKLLAAAPGAGARA